MVSFNCIFLHIHITVLLITIKDGSIMKKTYQKPDIMFDNFTLSTSIAASCSRIAGSPSLNSCGFIDGNESLFYSGMTGCTHVYDTFTPTAYETMVGVLGIFNSL